MRHKKHSHQLGVKSAHRTALMSNLCTALITHKQIRTTLSKAKALRPFTERVITLAKKARAAQTNEEKLHFYRQALSKVRDAEAVTLLFEERVEAFLNREGGYIRIYKLGNRIGDAAPMALIEMIDADDEGYPKRRKGRKSDKTAKSEAVPAETEAETEAEAKTEAVAEAESGADAEEPKAPEAAAAAVEPEQADDGEDEPKKPS